MRLPGKRNIWKHGDWQVDLSCMQVRHARGIVVGFHLQRDGSYQGVLLEGRPFPDPDPFNAGAQDRWLNYMMGEAEVALETAMSSNLH